MTPNGVTPNGVPHIGLTVQDFGRSVHFYRDLLGLRMLQEGTTDQAFPNIEQGRIYEQPQWFFIYSSLSPYGLLPCQ